MENQVENLFTITPMSQEISLAPGESYSGSISIVNPSTAKSSLKYRASITPFGMTGENGAVDLATKSNYSMLTDWLTLENPTGEVEPNGIKKLNYTITVPKDAPSGGQYATISVGLDETAKSSSGLAIGNVFEMASVIYARVAGETRSEGEILENNIPGFTTFTPITVSTRLKNSGNIHESATVKLKVSNFFTGESILPAGENTGEYYEVVMPDSTRLISREINELPLVGIVHIDQSVNYLGTVSTESKTVIICPIWFMLLILALLAGVITGVVALIRHHRQKRAIL